MARLNLVCAESNFIEMLQNNHLDMLLTGFNNTELVVSKVPNFKSIYATPKHAIKSFDLLNTLKTIFTTKSKPSSLRLVDPDSEVKDNSEIILFVNPSKELSKTELTACVNNLQENANQVIIDGVSYKFDCDDCSQKAYWSFVHWMEILQSSSVVGEDHALTSFIGIKKSLLNRIVDFQFEGNSVSYKKVI